MQNIISNSPHRRVSSSIVQLEIVTIQDSEFNITDESKTVILDDESLST
jgi:hypothetical protein